MNIASWDNIVKDQVSNARANTRQHKEEVREEETQKYGGGLSLIDPHPA